MGFHVSLGECKLINLLQRGGLGAGVFLYSWKDPASLPAGVLNATVSTEQRGEELQNFPIGVVLGLYRGYIGNNGKENRNCYMIGLYWCLGKRLGNPCGGWLLGALHGMSLSICLLLSFF